MITLAAKVSGPINNRSSRLVAFFLSFRSRICGTVFLEESNKMPKNVIDVLGPSSLSKATGIPRLLQTSSIVDNGLFTLCRNGFAYYEEIVYVVN